MPPETKDPIVILREISADREIEFLDEFLNAYGAGNGEHAAKCAASAISSKLDRRAVDSMISLASNLAYAGNNTRSLSELLCKAVDCGFLSHAYNAANVIMDMAQSAGEYLKAEHYFTIAMKHGEDRAIQAAAHVNYCAIVRDGLVSGRPDWPRAEEIYEMAARMGLAKAMFNAGNVCSWLADAGDREYGARAAYWFRFAIDHLEAGKTILDWESTAALQAEVVDRCKLALSALNIDAQFDGAQLEVGIGYAKELASRGDAQARHNLGVGYSHRLERLSFKPSGSPGETWREVLAQLDWSFEGNVATELVPMPGGGKSLAPIKVDRLSAVMKDGSVLPLFVTHEACLPLFDGIDRVCAIASLLTAAHSGSFLLLSRKAIFVEQANRSHTPVFVWHNDRLTMQALWMGSTVDSILGHAEEGVDFLDERFGNWSCMIPIAVNVLDEGRIVAEDAVVSQPYIGVGAPWRMPFFDKAHLNTLGLCLA